MAYSYYASIKCVFCNQIAAILGVIFNFNAHGISSDSELNAQSCVTVAEYIGVQYMSGRSESLIDVTS